MWLKQSIGLYPAIANTYGNSGQPTYGSIKSVKCLIQFKPSNTRDKGGNDVMSSSQIITAGSPIIGTEDKIVLPDGNTPKIIHIDTYTGFDGLTYAQVIFT